VDADDDAQVILYKATSSDDDKEAIDDAPPPLSSFTKWHYYDTILNKPLTDISIIYHPVINKWFMFGSRPKTSNNNIDEVMMMMMDIHTASSPLGPWTHHPASPYIPSPSGDRSMVGSQFIISPYDNDDDDDDAGVRIWRVGKVIPSDRLALLRVTLTEDAYIEEEEEVVAFTIIEGGSSSYKEGRWDWQGYGSITMTQVAVTNNTASTNKQWIAMVGASPYVVKKYPETEALLVMWYCNIGIVMFKILAIIVASMLVWSGVRSRGVRGVLVRSGIGRMVLWYFSNDDGDKRRHKKEVKYNKMRHQHQQQQQQRRHYYYYLTTPDTSISASFGDEDDAGREEDGDIEVGDDSRVVGYSLASSGTIKRNNIMSPSSYNNKYKKQQQHYIKRATKTSTRREKEEKPTHNCLSTVRMMKMIALLLSCTVFTGIAYLAQSALQIASPFLLQSPYSAPLPVKGEFSKFTLMVQSYEARLPNLKLYMDHYSKCPSVGEILIVYNTVQQNIITNSSTTVQDVLDNISNTTTNSVISRSIEQVVMYVLNGGRARRQQDTSQPQSSSPPPPPQIRVRVEGTNSMNNRYKPDPLIHHRGVLSLDDDLIIPCHDIEYAFSQWRKQPSSLVGFFPRLIDDNDTSTATFNTLQYHGEPYATEKGRYNLILSGAAFIDAWTYFPLYWSEKNKEGREMVDEVFNCDDILFNFIVHHHDHSNNDGSGRRGEGDDDDNDNRTMVNPIEFVRPERRLDLSGLSGVGISHQSEKFINTANVCLEKFVEMFGGNPLREREFEVGWRKPVCDEQRNELDCVWV